MVRRLVLTVIAVLLFALSISIVMTDPVVHATVFRRFARFLPPTASMRDDGPCCTDGQSPRSGVALEKRASGQGNKTRGGVKP